MGRKEKDKRRIGLRVKLAGLLLVVLSVLMAATLGWRAVSLRAQAEREMLQNTQVLAQEMDAVWEFMERNEGHFATDRDGVPLLYCVVAAKSVSSIFTRENTEDYSIRYTNTTVRRAADAPDGFEREALAAFQGSDGAREYYGLFEDASGRPVFRYAEPLFITESCLKCHGSPAGEIDTVGYPKEGLAVGDIAGCASIAMPAEPYLRAVRDSLGQDLVVFSLILLGGFLCIYFGFSRSSREIEEMNEALARESQYQSDFLSIMSHEIRTPLTSICAFADIWSETNSPRSPEEGEIMKEMRASSQVLLAMVNNILDMARLDAGRSTLTLEPVDMCDLAGTVAASLGFLAQKKGAQISVEVDWGVPMVRADYEKVRRILENLVSNAVKFAGGDGRVKVRVSYRRDSEELVLEVADNGCGIAEEDAPFIFDRFVQGAAPSGHRSGGSGLGLALVRELAQIHGGSARLVRGGPGDGAADGEYTGCLFEVVVRAEPCEAEEVEP